jgi:hypothetical protein
MGEAVEFISVAIPGSIYDQQVKNFVEALLQLDDKLFQEDGKGEIPASPKEAA